MLCNSNKFNIIIYYDSSTTRQQLIYIITTIICQLFDSWHIECSRFVPCSHFMGTSARGYCGILRSPERNTKRGSPLFFGRDQLLRHYNISFVNSFTNNFIGRFPNPPKKSWVYFHLEMV